ncbi:MAG: hypothetical protein PVSMB8_02380 [Vulcanimicrobiaceae bacterium]
MSIAAPPEPLVLIVMFVIGFACAAISIVIAAVRPAVRATNALRSTLAERDAALADRDAALADRDAALVTQRIEAAALRSDADHAGRFASDLRATLDRTLLELERTAANATTLERDLAAAHATIAQIKAGERDVDERFQRVAAQYVAEARDVLVKAAADRFQGDASLFREKLVASVAPLNERLESLGKSLTDLGTARTADQERVATLLQGLDAKMAGIDHATRRVERVLGNSQARGSWGEFELKRLLELTGMTEHVSFETQEAGYGSDATGRPDVVLRIPGNLTVPIDAKVPFARYQEAVSAQSEIEREPLMDQAVVAIRAHIKVLAARKYHAAPACIGWTIMFVPIEAMLATLFARDRDIFDVARSARVLIASPLTLMLYLEAFSRGWAAQKQSENATAILEEARTLVTRLNVFTEKFGKVGTSLGTAVERYNDAVASFEGRLGPQARKIAVLRGDTDEAPQLVQLASRARVVDVSRLPAQIALES